MAIILVYEHDQTNRVLQHIISAQWDVNGLELSPVPIYDAVLESSVQLKLFEGKAMRWLRGNLDDSRNVWAIVNVLNGNKKVYFFAKKSDAMRFKLALA